MARSTILKRELENINRIFSKFNQPFVVQSFSPDEICCQFKDGHGNKHIINCTITDSYPDAKPMWYSESDDKKVAEIMESLSEIGFEKKCQLVDMVKFLVTNLCHKFKIDVPSQVMELEDLKSKGTFDKAANEEAMDVDSDFDEDDEDEDIDDLPDSMLEEIVKAETAEARKEESEISDQNKEVLDKIQKIQRQKHTMGTVTAGSVQASDRLMKELKAIYKSDSLKNGYYSVELVNDSLYDWHVSIMKVDSDSPLHEDLKKFGANEGGSSSIVIGMSFHDTFPFDPPFVRVVSPVLTGGFVLSGGAICMELLTKQGWSGAYSIESVIVQIIATLVKGKARVNFKASKSNYSMSRAKQSFKRLVAIHEENGWYTPPKQDG